LQVRLISARVFIIQRVLIPRIALPFPDWCHFWKTWSSRWNV